MALISNTTRDKNCKDNFDRTPVHNAAAEGNIGIMEYLINHGCVKEPLDRDGSSPLHIAAYEGMFVCILTSKHTLKLKFTALDYALYSIRL